MGDIVLPYLYPEKAALCNDSPIPTWIAHPTNLILDIFQLDLHYFLRIPQTTHLVTHTLPRDNQRIYLHAPELPFSDFLPVQHPPQLQVHHGFHLSGNHGSYDSTQYRKYGDCYSCKMAEEERTEEDEEPGGYEIKGTKVNSSSGYEEKSH